jgi:hypothetical protein
MGWTKPTLCAPRAVRLGLSGATMTAWGLALAMITEHPF